MLMVIGIFGANYDDGKHHRALGAGWGLALIATFATWGALSISALQTVRGLIG